MHLSPAWKTCLALLPLVLIILGLGWKRWRSSVVTPVALGCALIIAKIFWGESPSELFDAFLEGATLAFWPILWTIFAAIFTYKVGIATGAVNGMQQALLKVSPDHRVQAIIIAFALGGFLEAMAGFGSAVAIPTGILIALGFQPMTAAVISLVANTVPVAFGALGIPVITLAQLTEVPVNQLTFLITLQLFPLVVLLPLTLVYIATGSGKGIRGVIPVALIAGLGFGLGQTISGTILGPELAAIVGSAASFLGVALWLRWRPVQHIWRVEGETPSVSPEATLDLKTGLRPWWPYIFALFFVLLTRLVPFLQFLRQPPFVTSLSFYPGAKPMVIDWFTSPGTLLILSALLGGRLQGAGGSVFLHAFRETLKAMQATIITVVSIVALAKVMGHSEMVATIAVTVAATTGRLFPFFSPLLGTLGTFLTGSDTSANVLFGQLQKETALKLSVSPLWLAAANTSGATAGKMISPQSIAIATAAAGLTGAEGTVLRKTLIYALIYAGVIGVLVWIGAFWF